MTKEKWGYLFFGCIAAILLSPLIWPYLSPVFGPKPMAETIAIENAEIYLENRYSSIEPVIVNCWYNDCCKEYWVDVDPEHSSFLPFRVYLDRKGTVLRDDLKDPLRLLEK